MPVDPKGPSRRPGSAATASESLRGAATTRPAKARRSGSQRLVLALGSVATVVVLLVASVVGYFNWRLGQIDRIDLGLAETEAGEPQNYLIVGSDSREGIDGTDMDTGGFLESEEYQAHPEGIGRRSDTIMVLRLDPGSKRAELLSFPRDLYVPIAGTDRSDKINAAFGMGVDVLVDTIQENFDIPINHYVEVDFVGFRKLIDAMGGVRLYFDVPMWDGHTGLDISSPGCHTLDGTQALAFARSRFLWYNTLDEPWVDTSSLQYLTDHQMGLNGWVSDGTSDLGRISRQQTLIRVAIPQAERAAFRNPATLNAMMATAVGSITVDSGLGPSRLVGLANRFRHFDPDSFVTYSYPATPGHSPVAGSILEPDPEAAAPILAKFRGETPGPAEADVNVRVLNASGVPLQAANVAGALDRVGFRIDSTADASVEGIGELETTQVRYAPDELFHAVSVARHLSAPVELVPLEGSTSDLIEVITGTTFTTVSTNTRELTADETAAVSASTSAPSSTSQGSAPEASSTAPSSSTTLIGVVPDQTAGSC